METNKEYNLVPGFGNSFGTGWRVMSDNFLRLFLVILILAVVAAPFKIFNFHFDPSDIWRSPYNWGYDLGHHLSRGPWNWGYDWGRHLFSIGTFGIFAAFFGLLAIPFWLSLYLSMEEVSSLFRLSGKQNPILST